GGKTEDLRYAYLLNGVTHDDVKEKIKSFEIDYSDITDEFLLDMIEETLDKKREIQEGISKLKDGSQELTDGLSELDKAGSELSKGAKEYTDGVNAAYEGAKGLSEGLGTLNENGAALSQIAPEFTAGVAAAYGGAASLNEGLSALDENSGTLLDGVKEYTEGVTAAYDGSKELTDGVAELQKETDKLLNEIFDIDIDNLTEFIKADENPRIGGCAGDVEMNKNAGALAGVILVALFSYVISVFVIHQIQRESSVIGALYALGAKKKDLIAHYILLPTVIAFIGGAAGTALGFSDAAMEIIAGDSYAYYSLPRYDIIHPAYLLVYGIVMPPVITAAVNALVINKRLSQTALSLIKNEQKISGVSAGGRELKSKNFIRRFQIRQLIRERRASITVAAGMFVSLLIVMISLDCYVMCSSVQTGTLEDTKFEYMYTLKYPPETVPENAESCYIESLSKEAFGYTLDVNIIGVDSDNKYYSASPEKGGNKITASSAAATKYSLSPGDKFILTDSANDADYAFTVTDIAEYDAGLAVFMDIDSMRELFGQDEDYYNVLLSDEELDIEEGRIYAVTTKADAEKSASLFVDMMMPMVTMFITVSSIILCVVIFLMMNVMIDRASFGISLVKIFGFNTKEVRKLYLNGNTVVIAVSAVVCIPLAKAAIDGIYPYFVQNVSAGMNLKFPWYMYVGLFCIIMAFYFIVNSLLVNKLRKISPAEALKNRE
ncbi:MAG: ABC transporter permease, partial [Ruminococcus sp.]|nr:ABC transporter permease [Ruminococcus sp.]